MKKKGVKPDNMHRKIKCAIVFLLAGFLHLAAAVPLFAQTAQKESPVSSDTVWAIASVQYRHPSFLRKLLLGKNYREEWATPVRLSVFDLKALGLRIEELGGGRQTKSLKLIDKDSVEWALRTVDKDVRPALPKLIRNPLTLFVVQDLVSAANPYGPLTIPPLTEALGITAAHPRFYFVPDDSAFQQFRPLFANTVCLLEKRDFMDDVETKGTMNMLEDIMQNHKAVLNQEAFLNARLLDMLIADWDRHYDQWKWAAIETAGKIHYLALPKDRDQAYFNSNGWLLKFIRLFGMKFSVGFTPETSNLVKLNSIALALDRMLLNGLDRTDWQRIAAHFQQQLSDAVIRDAIKELPPPIYALNGETITAKLLSREKTIAADVMKYYRVLAEKVTVYGTDKADHFSLTGNRDSVTLAVSDAEKNEPFYRRTFYPGETKKLSLLGLDGDDLFAFEDGLQTSIKFEIDGGKGKDDYRFGDKLKVEKKDSKMDAKSYLKKMRKPLRVREE